MAPEVIQPDGLPDTSPKGYSQARIDGGTLYVSGMSGRVGEDEDGNWIPAGPDVESQTRQAYENIELILHEAGRELSDIAKITSYIVDAGSNWEGVNRVMQEEVLTWEPLPCHTAIGIDRMLSEEFLLEVDVEVPMEH